MKHFDDQFKEVKNLLRNKSLVSGYLPHNIGEVLSNKREVTIVYGETYDEYGMTIDSLKYYLFLQHLSDILSNAGLEVKAMVIVGDYHSTINDSIKDKERVLALGDSRRKLIEKLKSIYDLNFQVKLMTELIKEPKYLNRLQEVRAAFQRSKSAQKLVKKTVLGNKIAEETEKGFSYALEEISLITDFDIKIGPPREVFFDKTVRLLSKQEFIGIYLYPTYPVGKVADYFVLNPEIDKFGLTPYKAGSNKMNDSRIVLETISGERLNELFNNSFSPRNKKLPNPIADLHQIGLLARHYLNREKTRIIKKVDMTTPDLVKKYVLDPTKEVANYV